MYMVYLALIIGKKPVVCRVTTITSLLVISIKVTGSYVVCQSLSRFWLLSLVQLLRLLLAPLVTWHTLLFGLDSVFEMLTGTSGLRFFSSCRFEGILIQLNFMLILISFVNCGLASALCVNRALIYSPMTSCCHNWDHNYQTTILNTQWR